MTSPQGIQVKSHVLVCCILQHVQALGSHISQAVAPACCRAQAQIRGSQEGQEAPSQQPSHAAARTGAPQQTPVQTGSLSAGPGCKGVTDHLKASRRQHSLHDLAEDHTNCITGKSAAVNVRMVVGNREDFDTAGTGWRTKACT